MCIRFHLTKFLCMPQVFIAIKMSTGQLSSFKYQTSPEYKVHCKSPLTAAQHSQFNWSSNKLTTNRQDLFTWTNTSVSVGQDCVSRHSKHATVIICKPLDAIFKGTHSAKRQMYTTDYTHLVISRPAQYITNSCQQLYDCINHPVRCSVHTSTASIKLVRYMALVWMSKCNSNAPIELSNITVYWTTTVWLK